MEPNYKEQTTLLLKETDEFVRTHITDITNQLTTYLDIYLKELIKRQKTDILPITNIQISFLYSSLYLNQPQFQLDAYGEEMYLTSSYYSKRIDASWLFTCWQQYMARIKDQMLNNPDRVFREAHLHQVGYQKVYHLLYYIFTYFKYTARNWEELESLEQLDKNADFYLSFGEYRDWQRVLYAKHPDIDLFNKDDEAILTFRKFNEHHFKKKTFENWKLMSSHFINCRFKESFFQKTILNDCRFEGCIFEEVTFKDVEIYGATFEDCIFKKVTFEALVAGNHGVNPEQIKEIFKNTEWIECVFENVNYKGCNLSYSQVIDCNMTGLQVIECNITNSDFHNTNQEE